MIIELAAIAVAGAVAIAASSVRVLREYERGVVFRLGRVMSSKGPGIIVLAPLGIDRMVKVPLRIVTMDIPPQDVITRDNVSVKVNAVVYFRVASPVHATIEIENYLFATGQLAQTTLRSVVGQVELDQLLAEREHINKILRRIIDEGTDPWGIEVTAVEVKDVDLPKEMKRAMAKQAEAERERRAKVIAAEGELQASTMLAQAAAKMGEAPGAMQLRFLQTVVEIAAENNSTTLFPIPIELFKPFLNKSEGGHLTAREQVSAGEAVITAAIEAQAKKEGLLSPGAESPLRNALDRLKEEVSRERESDGDAAAEPPPKG